MELFTIKKCFTCSNMVVDLDGLEKNLRQVMEEVNFSARLAGRLGAGKPKFRQLFHIALSGCPNSCSQPQIKDFGVQGQAVVELTGECSNCGQCISACPEGAITLTNTGAYIERKYCLNCALCVRSCPEGVLQIKRRGFRVLVGGKLGRHPRLATEVYALADEATVAKCLRRCVEAYLTCGRPGERFGSLVERLGSGILKE